MMKSPTATQAQMPNLLIRTLLSRRWQWSLESCSCRKSQISSKPNPCVCASPRRRPSPLQLAVHHQLMVCEGGRCVSVAGPSPGRGRRTKKTRRLPRGRSLPQRRPDFSVRKSDSSQRRSWRAIGSTIPASPASPAQLQGSGRCFRLGSRGLIRKRAEPGRQRHSYCFFY